MINDLTYWNDRFKTSSWTDNHGIEQSAYFAEVMINNVLPRVLYESASMLDWACALGQLCNKWKHYSISNDICGYDFSEVACQKAKELYPEIQFTNEVPKRKFDLVCSSNFLEHVDNWKDYLYRFTNMSEKYVVVLVPHESPVFSEHVVSFSLNSFPEEINNFHCIQRKVIQCNEPLLWDGKQQLLTYMKTR
jgi:trans-aconitate methyltransferase